MLQRIFALALDVGVITLAVFVIREFFFGNNDKSDIIEEE